MWVESPTQQGPMTEACTSLGVYTQTLQLASSIATSLRALGVQGVEVSVAASRWDAVLWTYLGMAVGWHLCLFH